MSKYKSLEEMIEEKRAEMRYSNSAINIKSIYQEIGEIAGGMTLEPVVREIPSGIFFKAGDKEFVTLLYRLILCREPDREGYANALSLLLSGRCDRAQLIEQYANSDEGKRKNVRIVGLKKEVFKFRICQKLKKIPLIGFLGRWITNIIFISRRIATLYYSINQLSLRCETLELQCESIKHNYEQARERNEELEHCYADLQNKYEDLKSHYENSQIHIEKAEAYYKDVNNCCQNLKKQNADLQELRGLYTLEKKQAEEKAIAAKKLCDRFYLHYNEKLMPDTRDEVKERAVPYIKKINKWFQEIGGRKEELKFVDLGCGECEWIELLSEHGFSAIGVDSNEAVVGKVKAELPEMKIVQEDAIQYLQKCEDDSIDCISSFHMVEHMDFLTIITMLKECYRVLKKNGMLIIETPNPQNILTSSYYFYLDPTHNKPIPQELMQFFLEETGFKVYERLLLNPLNFEPYDYMKEDGIKDIVFRFNMEQAYSIMVVKE